MTPTARLAAPPLDPARIRADFPLLAREVNGRPLVYLDSAATSQKPRHVIAALDDFYQRCNSNVHRGIHTLAQEATDAYEGARAKVARFVNAPETSCVVFTRNCTEAVNLVAYSWARRTLGPGDEILVTQMEHHSNLVPWQMAAADSGAALRHIPVTGAGELDLTALDSLLTPRTRLVALTGLSNVLGTRVDLAPVVSAARAAGALVLVDGAQLVPHGPVDFQAIGADFLAFSGHKMLGPTGVGVLVARPDLLDRMHPFLGGGEMIVDVTLERADWKEPPWKFEAGTPPIAEAVALGAAVDYLVSIGMHAVREHERELARRAVPALESVEGLILYGPRDPDRRGAVFSFNVGDGVGGIIHPHDVGTVLDAEGIAVRAGHHCAKPLMRRFNVPAMCRASCYLYNTADDIDALIRAVERARDFFLGRVPRGL